MRKDLLLYYSFDKFDGDRLPDRPEWTSPFLVAE